MKRTLLSFILAIGMVANIWADTVIEGIKYALNDDFTATVTGLDDPSFTGTVTIPETIKYYGNTYQITQIGKMAFYEHKFKVVNIGNSVTSIGYEAFSGCRGLTSVTISNSVTSIGDYAFLGCSSLIEINVDENNTAYSSIDGVLFNKSQTELILYPRRKQGTYTIPNSVTTIGISAFSLCSGLTSVTIGNSVTSIGQSAFEGCSGLTSVTIGNSVTSIGQSAFYGCTGLTSITIGNSVTSIGYYAFDGCSSLTEINVDENNTAYSSIDGVLFNKSQTELIRYPGGKQGAYIIPNSVTSIGIFAFYRCSGLTSVTIPNSVTSIGNRAFSGCSSLAEINVDENNSTYSSIDGVVFNKSQTELVCYPGGKQGAYTIPNSVTSIRIQAFYGCSGLTSVTIPNSVTSIGWAAFEYCSGLTSITIPNSVTSIGYSAFYNCSGLTSVTIPNSVTSIGWAAFTDCRRLTDIYCHIEEPLTIDSSVFNYVPTNTCTLHVPVGSKAKYKAADVWKDFLNIVEDLPTGIVSIDNSQLTIDNDVWFTLNGVRLNGKPTIPGIYIVNGLKVVIK